MQRIALLSVHTSPVAKPGGKKVGGMNTYVREIAQEFAQRGIHVDIYTRRTDPVEPTVDGSLGQRVRVINILAGGAFPMSTTEMVDHIPQFTASVMAYAMRNNVSYDLIFSHYWLSGLIAQKLKEAWGTPFVQMFHTLGHMKNRIPSVQAPVPDVRIQSEMKIVAWADRLIANTPAERAQLLWLYRADRRKITVCPPGVNLERFPKMSRAAARQHLAIPAETKLFLFAGRIEPLKAVDSIVEALALLKTEDVTLLDDVQLLIVGGDPSDRTDQDMVALQRLVAKHELESWVRFLPAKDQAELALYYAAANAVIMPSEYESFGMVALEAMATGTPVIASEVGGLAFLIKSGETGYLVPSRAPRDLAERMSHFIAKPHLSEQMGDQAADYAATYNWSAIADQLLTSFKRFYSPFDIRQVI